MIIDVITIFPGMFQPFIGESIVGRASKKGLVKINIHDLRGYSPLPHRSVDSPPYGGGGGMVFRCEPVFNCLENILGREAYPKTKKDNVNRVVYLTPQGRVINQKTIREFLNYGRVILICGRYEEIDERIRETVVDEEISIGDYVLSGGELAACVFMDALIRVIPGVVSRADSVRNESFEDGLLDYPQYTQPREFRGLKVPEVLISGDHKNIQSWRKEKSREITRRRRKDLRVNGVNP